MTYEEARQYFGLKDSDPVSESGVKSIIKSNKEQLMVWSIGNRDRQEIKKTIEACEALLRGINK